MPKALNTCDCAGWCNSMWEKQILASLLQKNSMLMKMHNAWLRFFPNQTNPRVSKQRTPLRQSMLIICFPSSLVWRKLIKKSSYISDGRQRAFSFLSRYRGSHFSKSPISLRNIFVHFEDITSLLGLSSFLKYNSCRWINLPPFPLKPLPHPSA